MDEEFEIQANVNDNIEELNVDGDVENVFFGEE